MKLLFSRKFIKSCEVGRKEGLFVGHKTLGSIFNTVKIERKLHVTELMTQLSHRAQYRASLPSPQDWWVLKSSAMIQHPTRSLEYILPAQENIPNPSLAFY